MNERSICGLPTPPTGWSQGALLELAQECRRCNVINCERRVAYAVDYYSKLRAMVNAAGEAEPDV